MSDLSVEQLIEENKKLLRIVGSLTLDLCSVMDRYEFSVSIAAGRLKHADDKQVKELITNNYEDDKKRISESIADYQSSLVNIASISNTDAKTAFLNGRKL